MALKVRHLPGLSTPVLEKSAECRRWESPSPLSITLAPCRTWPSSPAEPICTEAMRRMLRIFDAGVTLFAEHQFRRVGCRVIARTI